MGKEGVPGRFVGVGCVIRTEDEEKRGIEGAREEDIERVCEWGTLLEGSKGEGITYMRVEVRMNDDDVGEKDVVG